MSRSIIKNRLDRLEKERHGDRNRIHVISDHSGDPAEVDRQRAALIASGDAYESDLFVILRKVGVMGE
ncbi:hypothetical protein [Enterovirga rhinocerotis]|uniref:Uncharacterized protein n=1 Tax=Enterovirga rhinocerotis TaxID=1339210 RepID=A0A4R7CB11_9HYPH|nr:hypothetical protein [Enterovirga rhinocerotis]TDR95667.1 hypothetical protein EV668_0050 [Enterovirga rhinocerotis]